MDKPLTPLGEIIERQRAKKLQELQQSARDRGEKPPGRLGNRELSRRTADYTRDGQPVHWQTIGIYISGNRENPQPDKLVALAQALATDDITPSRLLQEFQEVAGLPVGDGLSYSPPIEIVELDRTQLDFIDETVRVLARANRRGGPAER